VPGAPTHFRNLLRELPWHTISFKRMCAVMLAQSFETNDMALAKGLNAQCVKWLIMSTMRVKDPNLAWPSTFLSDPQNITHPVGHHDELDLNSTVQDPSQITALVGVSHDVDLLNKRCRGSGEDTVPNTSGKPWKPKGKRRGEDTTSKD
jgi:hypothetical protein